MASIAAAPPPNLGSVEGAVTRIELPLAAKLVHTLRQLLPRENKNIVQQVNKGNETQNRPKVVSLAQ